MSSSSAVIVPARTGGAALFPWPGLTLVVVLAVLLRTVLFTGFFGSDEVTYTEVALGIAQGHWGAFDYIGSLRYGINLPNAVFMKLFGVSEFSANFWSLQCSVGEVALVFVFAYRLWGYRAALLSSIVIGVLPLHVAYGGRLLADAPLAFFITLSFLLFWIAEQRRDAAWYFGAGLAAGFVFWVKEVVVIYCMVFAVYALVYRRWSFKWLWMGLGALAMVGANCLLLWALTGDPLHIFNAVRIVTAKYVYLFKVVSSPWFYFSYLFVDIKHVWIMPYLALGGIVVWAAQAMGQRALDKRTGYVVVWALGLFSVFSFTPISFTPVTFIAKQVNYMLIFTAPLCMLAGYSLSRLQGPWLVAVLSTLVAGSLLLAALEQQVIRVFTANSKAAVEFAQRHRDTPVYGPTNAYRAGSYAAIMQGLEQQANPVRSLSRLTDDLDPRRNATVAPAGGPVAYAIIDQETMGWGAKEPIRTLDQVPNCWERREVLEPIGFGYANGVVNGLQAIVDRFPQAIVGRISRIIGPLQRPQPAYVYAIPADCRFSLAR